MPPAPATTAETRKRHASSAAPPNDAAARPSRAQDTAATARSADSPLTLTIVALLTVCACLGLFYFLGLVGPGEWRGADNLTATTPARLPALVDARLASSTGPVLLALYSRTCPACRRMRRPFTAACSKITDLSLPCFAVDLSAGDDNAPLVQRYGIKVVPTVVLARSATDFSMYDGRTSAVAIEHFARDQVSAAPAPAGSATSDKN